MFVNISTGDVYCTDIDRKMDSRRHGSSAVLADLEKMEKILIDEFNPFSIFSGKGLVGNKRTINRASRP